MSAPIYFGSPSEGSIVGLGIPFGSPSRADLDGEWFDKSTDFRFDMIEGDRPLLYHHGRDPDVGGSVIGRIVSYKVHETGVWWQAQLDLANRYAATIKELVRRGLLGFSSGALAHIVKVEPDGRIAVWPWIEGSLTTSPSSPLAKAYSVKSADALAHFAALRRVTSDDRDALRVIRSQLDGIEPARGLATPGMGGAVLIQPESPVHHA